MANELIPLSEGVDLSSVGPTRAMSTYNWQEPAQRLATVRAMGPADAILKDMVGDEIEIEHIVIYWAPYPESEDGEVQEGPRAVLVTPQGDRISTTSMIALRTLLLQAKWLSLNPPFKPPLRVRVCEKKGQQPGHRFLHLEVTGGF